MLYYRNTLDGRCFLLDSDEDIPAHFVPMTAEEVAAAEAPQRVVPEAVSMRQARLTLLQAGVLGQVDSALAAIPDETQRTAAQIEWEYATEVHRDSPLVALLGSALGLTDIQIDDLFIAAAGV